MIEEPHVHELLRPTPGTYVAATAISWWIVVSVSRPCTRR